MTWSRGEVWPWMVEEIAARIHRGDGVAPAVLGAAGGGPPPLRAAAEPAQRVWTSSGDTDAALRELRRAAGDPRMERLCALLLAAHTFDGDVAAVLARMRRRAAADAQRDRQLDRARSVVRFAARSALLPVVVVASGRLGTAPAAVALVSAAIAWAATALALRSTGVRVPGSAS